MLLTETLLRLRAHRILSDGLPHSPQALRWARGMLEVPETALDRLAVAIINERANVDFSARELSLGAQLDW